MPKLIVSLTTIPTRVQYLTPLLSYLKRQTLKPDAVELNVPHAYKHRAFSKADLALIPSDFTVHMCDDVGPATKVVPTLQRYNGSDTTIVYCDDDRIYSNNWLERYVARAALHPETAITDECAPVRLIVKAYQGINKDLAYRLKRAASFGFYRPYHFDRAAEPDIVEGYGGVLVKPQFFAETVHEVPQSCWAVDDIWLSANLRSAGTKVQFYGRKASEVSKPLRIDGQDIGGTNESLTLTTVGGRDRHQLNYDAVKYCIENLNVWTEHKAAFDLA